MSKSPTHKRRLLWCCCLLALAYLFSMPAAHAKKYACYRFERLPEPTVSVHYNPDSIWFEATVEGSNPNEYCWKMEVKHGIGSGWAWEVVSEDCAQTTGYWTSNVGQYYSWADAGIAPGRRQGLMRAKVQLHRKECNDSIRSPWGHSGELSYYRQ